MGKSILRGPVPKDHPMFSSGSELFSRPESKPSSTTPVEGMTGEIQGIPASLIQLVTSAGRVVPKPIRWKELWELLEGKTQQGNGIWAPPLPLILSAWSFSDDQQKRSRFFEHLDWALQQGQLEQVTDFLMGLAESDWYYGER